MKSALILSAGRGERLRPLTLTTPKPLCKINNIPIIDYHIQNLVKAGYTKIVINHAYLGWKIRNHINIISKDLPIKIIFSPEPPGGYETGGGIYNALKHFNSEIFTVINADIFTDFDLNLLEMPINSLAHLILVKNTIKPLGDFGLSPNNLINNQGDLIFSGIASYNKEMFANLAIGRYSITPTLRQLADQNLITGEIYSGKWIDIGTIGKLKQARELI
jgi:MurNAc alpha-1-phosphate uridylyltransferase